VIKVLDEHERTMAFAEVALGQINRSANRRCPRNTKSVRHATGYNSPLNKIINETLARNGQADRGRPRADLRDLSFPDQNHDRIDRSARA